MLPFMHVLGALWGNQWTRLAAVALFAAAFGFYKGFEAVPRVDVQAVVRNAEAGRDAEWSRKLEVLERQSREAVDAAIEARDHVSDPDNATVASLCDADRDCTDYRGQKR